MVDPAARRADIVLALLLSAATGLWFVVFSLEAGNFWLKLALAAAFLAGCSFAADFRGLSALLRFRPVDIASGVISAAALYGIFFLGNMVLPLILPGAERGIGDVYALKRGLPSILAGVALLVLTAFAEEAFWRGFVQRLLSGRLGPIAGISAAVAFYAGVHLWTMNAPLVIAAAVAGAWWAVHFRIAGRLWPVVISHGVWSVSVFLLFPVA